jgi:hypothetical protein
MEKMRGKRVIYKQILMLFTDGKSLIEGGNDE